MKMDLCFLVISCSFAVSPILQAQENETFDQISVSFLKAVTNVVVCNLVWRASVGMSSFSVEEKQLV